MTLEALYRKYQETMTQLYGHGPWTSLPLHHRWSVWSKLYPEIRRQITSENVSRAVRARMEQAG